MSPEPFPLAAISGPVSLMTLAVVALVVSDWRHWRPARYLFKPLAALAFVWAALSLGVLESSYGHWLLAGLLACLLGDLLLMFETDQFFRAGLFAFLTGHLLYAVAFLQLPISGAGLTFSLVPVALLLAGTLSWLMPHLDTAMRGPVVAYVLVIGSMLVTAGSTLGSAPATLILLGAWGFACSDLAVARRQFVVASPINGLWGTPLYFGSQMLLACSVALV